MTCLQTYFELVLGQWLSGLGNDVYDSVDPDVPSGRDVLTVAVGRPAHNVAFLARMQAFGGKVQVLEAGAPFPFVELNFGARYRLPRHRGKQLHVKCVGSWQRKPKCM